MLEESKSGQDTASAESGMRSHQRPFHKRVGELSTVVERASSEWRKVLDILNRPPSPEKTPFYQRFLTGILRTARGVFIDLYEGQLDLRAMSLVYTTLLSLVPMLAISFSVLKGFDLHTEFEPILLSLLAPLGEKAEEITKQIMEFVDNARVTLLGAVGFGFLFYIVISLMQKIEMAFNFVWRTQEQRTWPRRVRDYLGVITIGPLLVITAIGALATIMGAPAIKGFTEIESVHWVMDLVQKIVPTIFLIGALTFMYMYMPVARVRFSAALAGGFVTGILWNVLGWVFAAFIASSSNYATIYTSFATPIVFMVWLYFNWLLLLVGASITFYTQHPEYTAYAGRDMRLGNQMKERFAVLAAAEIGRAFYAKSPPHTLETLARNLGVPAQGMNEVLETLEDGGLIGRSGDRPSKYLPAQPWDTTTLKDLLDIVRGTQPDWYALDTRAQSANSAAIAALDTVEGALATAAGHMTLKDLSTGAPLRTEDREGRSEPDRA